MRRDRVSRKQIEQLIRSGKTDYGLPEGLAQRVRAAIAAAPRPDHSHRQGLGRARRLISASAATAGLAVIALALANTFSPGLIKVPSWIIGVPRADGTLFAVIAAQQPVSSARGQQLEVGVHQSAHGSRPVRRRYLLRILLKPVSQSMRDSTMACKKNFAA